MANKLKAYSVTYTEDTIETRRYTVEVNATSDEAAKAAALDTEREDDEDGAWVYGETHGARKVSEVTRIYGRPIISEHPGSLEDTTLDK